MKAEPNEGFDCYHAHSLVIPIAGEEGTVNCNLNAMGVVCYAEYFRNRSRSKGKVLRACMLLKALGER